MGNGLFTARIKKKQRKKLRKKSKDYVLRLKRREEKKDLLEGAPVNASGYRSSRTASWRPRSSQATAPSTT